MDEHSMSEKDDLKYGSILCFKFTVPKFKDFPRIFKTQGHFRTVRTMDTLVFIKSKLIRAYEQAFALESEKSHFARTNAPKIVCSLRCLVRQCRPTLVFTGTSIPLR